VAGVTLDGRVVLRGAVADLAVLVPMVLLYVIFGGWALGGAVAGALVGPVVGGVIAGRQPIRTPLTHGAAAAAAASIGYVIFRLLDAVTRDRPVHVASIVFLVIVATTLGLMGGWIGFRSREA
jgi:hypothetical protein